MAKVTYFLLVMSIILVTVIAGCGGKSRVDEPTPINPMQEALSKMPLAVLELPGKPLKMKAFLFNNIDLTAKSRGLTTQHIRHEEEQIAWMFAMGHNITTSMSSVIDFGKWHHTEFLNQTTWSMNLFDYTRDHEVVFSNANGDDFLAWMLRHNFEVFVSEPALTLKPSRVHHRDAYVFGAGIVYDDEGATFICREMPTDGTVDSALGIYQGTEYSLLGNADIYELSADVPEDAFSAMICRLETSISSHNQITTTDTTGFSGVPMTEEQTIWITENGRPEELSWFSLSHIIKDGHNGLLWKFRYDNEQSAIDDVELLTKAINTAKGRFSDENWWTSDMHLEPPEINRSENVITVWSEWIIPDEPKQKLESGNMTDEEQKTLWFEYVKGLFDIFDRFERQDYGPLWQRF